MCQWCRAGDDRDGIRDHVDQLSSVKRECFVRDLKPNAIPSIEGVPISFRNFQSTCCGTSKGKPDRIETHAWIAEWPTAIMNVIEMRKRMASIMSAIVVDEMIVVYNYRVL
jgi:hypothetical protein